ncbi:MAG TPA: hypothetical protein VMX97_11385 [Hyphomicrobiaceae bacterium]|nr:hypothetical protein [Hyphomicrobiaceae bacterium]
MARLDYGIAELAELSAPAAGPDALFELGLMYSAGRDVEMDLVTAHKWFNLAALRGNEEAKIYRMEISRDLSRADVARAQRLAREWLRLN